MDKRPFVQEALWRTHPPFGSRRRDIVTTQLNHGVRPAPDLVDGNFTADRPNQLWLADITYDPTAGGRCREAGARPSIGSVGDAYDNAMCENFFATPLECQLLAHRRFASQAEARTAVFSPIEVWYNPGRRIPASAICYPSLTRLTWPTKPPMGPRGINESTAMRWHRVYVMRLVKPLEQLFSREP